MTIDPEKLIIKEELENTDSGKLQIWFQKIRQIDGGLVYYLNEFRENVKNLFESGFILHKFRENKK